MGTPSLWDRIKWFVRDLYLAIQALRYRKVPWHEYVSKHVGKTILVDLDTIPHRTRMDYDTRNTNILWERKLCEQCAGTGNEYFFMYKQCSDCQGRGY